MTITGRLVSDSGDALTDNAVQFVDGQSEDVFSATTDSNGAFQVELPGDTEYIFNYVQSSSVEVVPDRPDDVPSHLLVQSINVGSDAKDLGTVELPRAYRVRARVVDANSRPVQGATIQIRSEGFGLPPGTFTTNSDGYIKHSGADRPGVDLAGPVQIGAWPPGARREGRPQAVTRVLVDQKRSLTLNLESVDSQSTGASEDGTTSTAQAGTGGTGGGGRERGFFSNSGNEPAFLSDVFSLTMLGFLMSAAGLIYQMTEGR